MRCFFHRVGALAGARDSPRRRDLWDPVGTGSEFVIYAFGEFELDTGTYELRRDRLAIRLEPKVFDVLLLLVRHPERVVTKTEFLETLWAGEHVTESALPRAITAARKALKDDRVSQTWIRTVHGRGYQFAGDVRECGAPVERSSSPNREHPSAALPALVGREAALTRMTGALREAEEGRGRLLLLFGEPGIGKTRTAEAFLETARERGFEVLSGRCYEGEGAPAFWPWVQILRGCTEELEGDELVAELGREAATVVHLVPELALRLAEAPAPLSSIGDEARFRLFEGVTRFLLRRSHAKPLALLLDDVHWADKPSALLLRFLATEMKSHRLLVVGAYRDVELRRGSPLGAVLGDLSRSPRSERIRLHGLGREAVGRLVEDSLGAPPENVLVDAVAEITQGNPFFVNETLRLLRAERASGEDAEAWEAALPQGLRDVVGRRLDGLSPECNRVLTRAAVIGMEFALPVLARFADAARAALLETLHEAVGARVIVESPERPGCYAFSHALIQQCIYEELPTPVRVRLHREVGQVLEALYHENPDPHLDALAHHFFQAAPGGDVDKAVDYAARAGAAAQRLFAYEEAAGWYTRALQALDLRSPDDATRRCELLLALGGACDESGDRPAMRDAFSQAAERARSLGRADLLALAAIGFSGRTERGTPDTGMRALLEEALAALGDGDPGLRARLLNHLVGTPPYDDSDDMRLAMAREAGELARASGDPVALIAGVGARAWALMGPDHVEERLRVADELDALQGGAEAKFTCLEARLRSLLVLGDMERADREIADYVQLADELRQPVFRFIAHMYLVARALSCGRFAEAETLIARGHAYGEAAQHPAATPASWGQRFWLEVVRGDLPSLSDVLSPLANQDVWVPGSGRYLVEVLGAIEALASRREPEARRRFDDVAEHDFLDVPRNEHWSSTMAMCTILAANLGDARRAARLHEILAPYAALNTMHETLRSDLGSVAYFLGLLARTQGRLDQAAADLETAIEANARMGALPHLARSQAELAEVLAERGRPDDAPRVSRLREHARATATALGMVSLDMRFARSASTTG